MRVLMVCLGNICRSPAAEVVLRHMAAQGGRATIEVDSCGTSGWHQGQSPYGPMITASAARGYELRGLRARKLHRDDFTRFDLIVALDQSILHDIEKLRPATSTIPAQLLNIPAGAVPDPYYTRDFDQALDLIETGCRSLLDGM
ncbi:low molecular weight protein-tyrosine-phosphatase [Pseudorhodobacter sp.]|uniref:low molecular weight protein-tyrosine-phosphatase n=1 Tax=Pseudorhodobacter sp. TaxID=1934400 RepID=UPI002647DA21|nr:low molecular weight protein-tyrosine-phosphatase [Pseudorhodobacter sp.]MDN5786707.1 low molecular weight phosphotyrosine protein phosphatase [Pseudorhodobacter sp.]